MLLNQLNVQFLADMESDESKSFDKIIINEILHISTREKSEKRRILITIGGFFVVFSNRLFTCLHNEKIFGFLSFALLLYLSLFFHDLSKIIFIKLIVCMLNVYCNMLAKSPLIHNKNGNLKTSWKTLHF